MNKCIGVVLTTCVFSSGLMFAADNAPTLRQGNLEVGALFGAGYGLGSNGGGNFHFMGAGDFGYAFTKNIFGFAEAGYLPSTSVMPNVVVDPGLTYTATPLSRNLTDFDAGVHIRIPISEKRFVPYILGSVGGVHSGSASTDLQVTDPRTNPPTVFPKRTIPFQGETDFTVSTGAGSRFYVNERFGFRVEFKYYKPVGDDPLPSFYRFAAGVFFQLR